MDKNSLEERIRSLAGSTDKMITKLDTLTNRIDTAKVNENQELVEYYERQFAEASVEFMNGVETILDDWYALKGVERPPAEEELLSPEMLDEIHSTVVGIVQGLSVASPEGSPLLRAGIEDMGKDLAAMSDAQIEPAAPQANSPAAGRTKKGPDHKVDFTG